MITEYKIFEQTQTQKFEIPEQIRKFYIIEGDMSNSRDWKTTKYFLPFVMEEEYRKSALGIRYILISLDSNHIIPININDEHRVGYDVLINVFYEKYKIEKERYVSVCTWGNHYVYNIDSEPNEKSKQLTVLKKYLEYGGNPNLPICVRLSGGNGGYEMPLLEFIKYEGDLKKFKKDTLSENKISPKGLEFINLLTQLNSLWIDYRNAEMDSNFVKQTYIGKKIIPLADEIIGFICMQDRDFKLLKLVYDKFYKELNKFESDDVDKVGKICDTLFTHNGIKNFIHLKLKEPKNKDVEEFFWNVKKAKIEFDRLSQEGEIKGLGI